MPHMLTRRSAIGAGVFTAVAATLAACGKDDKKSSGGDGGPVELTMSAWSLQSSPVFQALADDFHSKNPDITITVNQYDADDYDTQLTADMSANKAPDLITVKNSFKLYDYAGGGMLADLTDVIGKFKDSENINVNDLKVDDKYYAMPFREDIYVTFYNKNLFDQVGVPIPDGKWTWDEFNALAIDMSKKFEEKGIQAKGAFVQPWPGPVQGFAIAQTPNASKDKKDLSGDLGYMKPFYERALALQDQGGCQTFATCQSQKLHYRSEFGTQKAAMTTIGSWYLGMLASNQADGSADQFEWGIVSPPQVDSSTYDSPVTYTGQTTIAVSAAAEGDKLEACKKFIDYLGTVDAAKVCASTGVPPAYHSDEVTDFLFDQKGMPQDETSKKAYNVYTGYPASSFSPKAPAATQILNDLHTSVMTEAVALDEAIEKANKEEKSEGIAG